MAIRIRPLSSRQGSWKNRLLGGSLLGLSCSAGGWCFAQREPRMAVAEMHPPIVAAYDMIEIPVPLSPVLAGTPVRDIPLHRMAYPRHQIPPGTLTSLQEVRDMVSAAPLPANMPLFSENFIQHRVGFNSVVSRIPSGMRAMTIKVDVTSSVEGWAGSGSVVDVLLIGHEKTSVIAEKVKILSAERVVVPVEGNSSPQIPSTVTLLVNQEQCLAINTAIPLGKIAFALRSPDDQESWISAQYTAERLKGRDAVARDKPSSVSGFVTINGEKGERSFALSGEEWIETTVVPQGFRVMLPESERTESQELPSHAKKEYRSHL